MKDFKGITFKGKFRDYQQKVIDNAPIHLKDNKIHIVAAPGSGKTIVGLELIRMLAKPAIIFSPSVTIRQQWSERFAEMYMPEDDNLSDYFSFNLTSPELVTSVTYQALHAAYNKLKIKEDNDDEDELESQIPEDYTGFDLMGTIKKAGIKVICLDEAHHLRSEWQKALEGFINELRSEVTVIALTATPPYDSAPAEWQRYISLCGEIDDEIFVPQLVAQKTLCPHQDYIYFNYPTNEEVRILQEYRQTGAETAKKIIEDGLFRKIFDASGISTHYKTQEEEIIENADGVASVLSIAKAIGITLPSSLVRLVSPSGKLSEYSVLQAQTAFQYFMDTKNSGIESLVEEMVKILKANGLIDKNKVLLDASSKIKSMLISSQGKLVSINRIVKIESDCLKDKLRMLILTDYIKKDMKNLIGTNQAITSLGTVPIFESVRRTVSSDIKLAILSGGLVILPQSIIEEIKTISDSKGVTFTTNNIPNTQYCEVNFSGSNKNRVAVVTEAFQNGLINVMTGTKSLLGEGWDSPCINSLILASFVGSFMLSNQMRGRAIRMDKNNPDKAANIWHLVTIEPPKLFAETLRDKVETRIADNGDTLYSSDFEGLTRRFDCFLAPAYSTDRIESGINRIDIINPPFNEEGFKKINAKTESLACDRKAMAEKWSRSLNGVMNPEILQQNKTDKDIVPRDFIFSDMIKTTLLILTTILLILLRIKTDNGFFRFVLLGTAVVVLCFGIKYLRLASKFSNPKKTIKALCDCVLKTLQETGDIQTQGAYVTIMGNPYNNDVYFALTNATTHEKNVFSTATKEMLSAIDNPRYLIIKQNNNKKYDYVTCFACPSIISTKKETVEILTKKLSHSMTHFVPLFTRSKNGREHILKAREYSYLSRNQHIIESKKHVLTK